MEKIDLKKLYKTIYSAKPKFEIINVPKLNFLTIEGCGNPNISQDYFDTITALYSLSYAIKFHSKKKYQKDYVVAPLEGLWWADDWADFILKNKDKWQWKMLIMQPQWISNEDVIEILAQVKQKKPNPRLESMKFETIEEGLCVQILHIGSYDDEAPILEKLHNDFIPNNNFKMRGIHHEIYLSDPRKVKAEKLKTILRQPILKE